MTMIELDQELERLRGSVLFDDEPVRALYRAALARTEAAEAEAADAILVASDAERHAENAMHGLAHFRARVAELEARAEAAEKLVAELKFERSAAARRAYNTEVDNQQLTAENRRLAARVAELEAAQAAQGWRPVTEDWPPLDGEYLVWCSSYAGCEIQSYSKRLNRWYGNTGNDADYWQPLPPAPQETE